MRPPSILVAALLSGLVATTACTGGQTARPEARDTTTAPASTMSATTIPATTLTPPPFKARAAVETREEEWRNIGGSVLRECVDVGMFQHLARQVGPDARNIVLELRSGEWVAGSFFDLPRGGVVTPSATLVDPTYHLKIYWVGLARDPQTPVITANSLSEPARPMVRGTTSSASGAGGTFTASEVPLPSRGRWRIIGASADQWGCYDVVI